MEDFRNATSSEAVCAYAWPTPEYDAESLPLPLPPREAPAVPEGRKRPLTAEEEQALVDQAKADARKGRPLPARGGRAGVVLR